MSKTPWTFLARMRYFKSGGDRFLTPKSNNSKRIHRFEGHQIGWGRAHSQGFEKWAKLSVAPDLSPEFRHQIERNLQEKS